MGENEKFQNFRDDRLNYLVSTNVNHITTTQTV